jgi:signal transduction histidine kinase
MLPSVGEVARSTTVSPLAEAQPEVASNVIEFPVRHDRADRESLERDIVLELATADDVASGMVSVVERIRRDSGATGVQWWATGDDGALGLAAATGNALGVRESLPLGGDGVLVLHDGSLDPDIESALMSLAPILRRRAAEERLARMTVQLARRNEALEDFAALVAHELKTPLQAALVADDPGRQVEDALHLVDALLESAQNEGERTFASAAESLDQAVEDLGAEVEITADLATTLPLPPEPLRVILRNLISNAVAAGAGHVHVTAARSPRAWRLFVDDDGVGLGKVGGYAGGSGLGLSLSRRIAGRFGGVLALSSRLSGGTRATLEFKEARP